jgi:hypothetical protein
LLMQITSKDQLDNLIRLLCGAPLASIKNCWSASLACGHSTILTRVGIVS